MLLILIKNNKSSNFHLDEEWGRLAIGIFYLLGELISPHRYILSRGGVGWPIAVYRYSSWATALHPLLIGWGGGSQLVNNPGNKLFIEGKND